MNLRERQDRDDVHLIHLAQDTVQWQAFVTTVMNLRFPKMLRISYYFH
jgi:hypothetical protein